MKGSNELIPELVCKFSFSVGLILAPDSFYDYIWLCKTCSSFFRTQMLIPGMTNKRSPNSKMQRKYIKET